MQRSRSKAENAEARGYKGLIIFNNTDGARRATELLNMDFTVLPRATSSRCSSPHASASGSWAPTTPATYTCRGNAATSTPTPPAPVTGVPVSIDVEFDGWGYAHLYRAGSGKLDEAAPYAIPEAIDER